MASLDMKAGRQIDKWVGLMLCAVLFGYSRLRARLGGPAQPGLRATTPPVRDREPLAARRILAIKTYGLGNVAMLLPVLGALRRAYPEAEIDFLTLESNRPLLERSRIIDRVLGLGVDGYAGFLGSVLRVLFALRSRGYDLVIDFEQFIKLSTILAFLSGAPHRVGFNTDAQRRGWLYTNRVVYRDSEHMMQIFSRPLLAIGIDPTPASVEVETTPEEQMRVRELISSHGKSDPIGPIAVHVGSGPNFYRVSLKRWPTEHFAWLCDRLVERHGARLVFTGKGREEAALIRDVMVRMEQPAVDSCDRLAVGELIALLKSCRLVITNDTSVMHIAALVGVPVVSFFGATDPLQYGPRSDRDSIFYAGLPCSPCLTNYNLKMSYCSDPVCIRQISPRDVLEKIEAKYFDDDAPAAPASEA
jgi:heptosyltransferase-2